MIKSIGEEFYNKINLEEYDGMLIVTMQKEKFIQMINEEIENYGKDTQAEVGMGIYTLINDKRKYLPDHVILDNLINICKGLIEKSPECALEFSKRLEIKRGI